MLSIHLRSYEKNTSTQWTNLIKTVNIRLFVRPTVAYRDAPHYRQSKVKQSEQLTRII